jgi:hypothetical protein
MFVFGTNSVAACIRGTVYYLTYDRLHRFGGRRITPADAELIPWNSLDHHENITHRDGHIAEIILRFARQWRFQGEFYFTHVVRLVRSTRGRTLRRICASRRAAAALSFAMGGHRRLGDASIVQLLDDNLARMVVSLL